MKCSVMIAAAVLSSLSMPVFAQSAPDVSAMPYESAFKSYQPMQEIASPPTLEAWREANDTVARIGGHAGVLKGGEEGGSSHAGHGAMSMEKQPAETTKQPSQSAPPTAPAKASPHQGH